MDFELTFYRGRRAGNWQWLREVSLAHTAQTPSELDLVTGVFDGAHGAFTPTLENEY